MATNLKEIEEVQIDSSAEEKDVKFILVKISRDDESRIILKSTTAPFHSDMYKELAHSLGRGLSSDIIGGGYLHVDKPNRTVKVWGSSNVFGPPDYRLAKTLLGKRYLGFEIYVLDANQ